MRELLLVMGIVALLVVGGLAIFLPVRGLMELGAWMVGGGFAFGVPPAIVYHAKLYRALVGAHLLKPGWYWRPTSYHGKIDATAYRAMRPWFMTGGAGFLTIVVGIIVMLTGMGRALFAG